MAFIKIAVFASLLAVIAAQQLQQDYSEPAKYSFQYSVADPSTGDQKEQQEDRDGDNVRGFYTVVEADGTLRRVDYTADAEHGFQAVVTKQAGAAHPIQVARTVVSQPAVHVVSQPAVHVVSQPAAHVVHAAPTVAVAPQYIHAAPVTSQIVHHAAPLTTQYVQSSPLVHHAPVVSTVPQYITRTVAAAPSQYILH